MVLVIATLPMTANRIVQEHGVAVAFWMIVIFVLELRVIKLAVVMTVPVFQMEIIKKIIVMSVILMHPMTVCRIVQVTGVVLQS